MSWLVLAAETAGNESSKTPYYVLGCALAAWAVIVAFVGITQPGFPGKAALRGGVIGFTALLVASTAAAAVLTA